MNFRDPFKVQTRKRYNREGEKNEKRWEKVTPQALHFAEKICAINKARKSPKQHSVLYECP